MALAVRIFVTTQNLTHEGSLRLAHELGQQLKAFLEQNLLAGFQATAITEEAQFDEENLDRDLVETVTEGRLPAVYVNITYDDANPRQLAFDAAAFMATHGFRQAWPLPQG